MVAHADVALTANYNPRALQLDTEGNVDVHTGPIVTSFFGMLRRVYRIEVRPYSMRPISMTSFWAFRDGLVCTRG